MALVPKVRVGGAGAAQRCAVALEGATDPAGGANQALAHISQRPRDFVPIVPFNSMPDDARVWVFGASQPVHGGAAERVLSSVDRFIRGWLAHGQPVVGACDWRYDRFLMIAADEEATGVSGCSIDSLFRTLSGVEREQGITLLDASFIWYRDSSGSVQCVTRPEFRGLIGEGVVNDDTIVFDNTVGSVGGVRESAWERPVQTSWHGKAFLGHRK